MENQQTGSADYWKEQMLAGNFENAWKFSDEVLKQRKGKPCWHLPRHEQYIWDGSSLENKVVLIRCYHGLGDTIQFIRFARPLKDIAKRVIVWTQSPLIQLLETVDGVDELLELHEGSPEVEYDTDVEVMELPYIFRTTVDSIPLTIPYIHVQPLHVVESGPVFKVGIVWKVSDWDESRSIPFQALRDLFSTEGVYFVILQHDPVNAGWQEGTGHYPGPFSLYDFARVVKGLDLLITADSMPAHIAGAMGVPAWTLLKKDADWRWMNSREDSPWYPTMRLFRQTDDGDWSSVIQRIKEELRRKLI